MPSGTDGPPVRPGGLLAALTGVTSKRRRKGKRRPSGFETPKFEHIDTVLRMRVGEFAGWIVARLGLRPGPEGSPHR